VSDVAGNVPADSVVVEYELTRDEAIPFFRWQVSQAFRMRIVVVMMVMLAALGAVFLAFPRAPKVLGVAMIGLAVLELLGFGWLYVSVPARSWKKFEADRGSTTYEFTDESVRVHTKNTDAVNRWAAYSESIEHHEMYLLRVGKRRSYVVVPKRAFRSRTDETVFRSLAERHTVAHLWGSPT
jgi:hypothetical protein